MNSSYLQWETKLRPHSSKLLVIFLILMIITTCFVIVMQNSGLNSMIDEVESTIKDRKISKKQLSGLTRAGRVVSFTEISTGLPNSGEYNFIAFGDINNDLDIDIAFGGEDYSGSTTGLMVYTGNGGTSWSMASSGLPTENSWGGLALVDADEDGFIELYATDEHWGSNSNSGLKVWEYRSGSWTDEITHVSTPSPLGKPDNVIFADITGGNRLDLVLCAQNGIRYFQNDGGNPVIWNQRSTGLTTSAEFTGVTAVDVNKDDLKDLVAGDYSGGEHLFVQQTTGNLWAEHSDGLITNGSALGVSVGDVNNDTHMDIVFGTRDDGLKCWLGNSGGGGSGGTSFSWTDGSTNLPTNARYGQIQLVDIDLDNDLDLIAPCASNKGVQIYFGNGNTNPGDNMAWELATNTNLPSSGNWYGANCYDIDGDGSLDIVIASWGDGIKAYLNDISQDIDHTPPGEVTDLAITNVTNSTITVNWTAPADNGTDAGSGAVQYYDVRYSISNIDSSNWNSATPCTGLPTPAAPGTPQCFEITGLTPGTLYYIALRSVDERPNLSPISNVVSDSTLGGADITLPGQINDLAAINPTENSIELSWNAPADNGSDPASGVVAEYDIRYNTTPITNATWDLAMSTTTPITPGIPGSVESYIVTGLLPGTTYYFALKAGDEIPNWGWLSNIAYNTTLAGNDSIPPAAITDLSVVSTTDTTITLTWTAPGDDGDTGTANEYDLRYLDADITPSNWDSAIKVPNLPKPQPDGIPEIFQVNGLQPNTTYFFAIKTGDEVPNWSSISNSAIGTTLNVTLSTFNVSIIFDKSTLESNLSTNLVITVLNQTTLQPVQAADVELSSSHPALVITPASGQTNSEGILNIMVMASEVTTNTEITLYVNISHADFNPFNSQAKLTVIPQQPPTIEFNLQINPIQIILSPTKLIEGDEIIITANLTNLGPDDATGFTIRFLIDGDLLKESIQTSGPKMNEFVPISVNWVAIEGQHNIRVEIIPMEPIYESNSADNTAQKGISVSKKETTDDGDSGDAINLGSMWPIIIIIIVVVILLILFFITRKRKEEMEYTGEGAEVTDLEQMGYEEDMPILTDEFEEVYGVDEEQQPLEEGEVQTLEEEEMDEEEFEEEFIPDEEQEHDTDLPSEPETEQEPELEGVSEEEPPEEIEPATEMDEDIEPIPTEETETQPIEEEEPVTDEEPIPTEAEEKVEDKSKKAKTNKKGK